MNFAPAFFIGAFLLPFLARADALDQWMTRTSPVPVVLNDVVYGVGQFVAIGTDTNNRLPRLIASSNGVDWIRYTSFAQFSLRSVTLGSNGLFVAVGRTDLYDGTDTPGVIVSTNGTNWSFFPTFGDRFVKTNFESVTYGHGQFMAVGLKGIAASSSDGTNWNTYATPTPYLLTGVAYGNGVWVAVGPKEPVGGTLQVSDGPLLTSIDGINWVQQNSAFNATRVLFARGMFIALAGDTFGPNLLPMRYSYDGTNWMNFDEPDIQILHGITCNEGIFVAVGRGIIKASFDGTNWVRRFPAPAFTNRLFGVAYGANTFVAVGDGILQSEDIRPRLGFFFHNEEWVHYFTLSGLSNALYRIEISTNLVDWTTSFTTRELGDGRKFDNPDPATPQLYYRATHVPE